MAILGTLFDLALVIIGFGLIIFLHELGHFVAAKWAGIRVLAFAMGFGPALCSYRKGLGLRWGSSAPEFDALTRRRHEGLDAKHSPSSLDISPTEYRLNVLPLGGYVKMLGQEDDNPAARSSAPDSYQMCKPWKRMIVISAGVIMNVITAAALFMIVFTVGLRTEPAKVGFVSPAMPAATAVAINSAEKGVTEPGLRPGDVIVSIDGEPAATFKQLQVETAMAAKGRPLRLEVERRGVEGRLIFEIVPKEDPASRLQALGLGPAAGTEIPVGRREAQTAEINEALAKMGLPGVQAGARLTRVANQPEPAEAYQLNDAARASGGSPFEAEFANPDGAAVTVRLQPRAELQTQTFRIRALDHQVALTHLLGLAPVMTVAQADVGDAGHSAGLRTGDIFARIGDAQYPSLVEGIAEIRRNSSGTVDIAVLRSVGGGARERVELAKVPVDGDGRVGFAPGSTADTLAMVTRWPSTAQFEVVDGGLSSAAGPGGWSGALLGLVPGTVIESVNGQPVGSLAGVRDALVRAIETSTGTAAATMSVRSPRARDESAPESVTWRLSTADAAALSRLAWLSPISAEIFEPERILQRADSPLGALGMGLAETRRAMIQTYLTFARLFQGTVKVEHLKGPVGIAHVGTLIADRGFIWLLFFMAVISVNLAVINFLPLPIVDGGHFLFLVYEQVTGKPVSPQVQGIATIAGLLLIGSMFVIVTYNDLANLLWR